MSPADIAGYLQIGWPRCCGGVMTYALEGEDAGEQNPAGGADRA